MRRYTKEFFEELSTLLYVAAENLARELVDDSINNAVLTVEVECETFDFEVEATMNDYKYEESTNSASYNTSVYCTYVPAHTHRGLNKYMKEELLYEYLYRD